MVHKLDAGNNLFRDALAEVSDTSKPLPLVHCTDGYALRTILTDRVLRPQTCNVFSPELLTYLFYGRPSYRPNIDAQPTTHAHFFPICLIFKPHLAFKVKRIFPFDSGAFQREYYTSVLHPSMRLGDFALEPDLATPGKVVTYFFGSNGAYMSGQPGPAVKIDKAQFEVASYASLVSNSGSNAVDSRSTTIEIQTEEILDLADCLQAVILPNTFVSSSFGDRLEEMNVEVLPYHAHNRFKPDEFAGTIEHLCTRYYIDKALIDVKDLG